MPATSRGLDAQASGNPAAVVLLVSVGSLLATSAMFAKAAPAFGWSPLALLLWSLLGAALLQGALLVQSRGHAGLQAGQTRGMVTYLLVSALLFTVPNALAFMAAPHVGAGFIALCFAFPLVLTFGLSVAFGLDRLALRRAGGVAFGLLGGLLMAVAGRSIAPESQIWILAALSVPVVISVGNVYRTLKWPKGASPLVLSAGMMALGGMFAAIFGLALSEPLLPSQPGFEPWLLAGGQAAVFAVQYYLYFQLQKVAGPVYLSQIGSVAAIAGLGLAFVLFGEVPVLAQVAAVLAVGAGVVLVSRG